MNAKEGAKEELNDGTGETVGRDGVDERVPWHRREWTTIVLEAAGEGWRATQTGVDVVGRGETAAAAAADYCRRIDDAGGDTARGGRADG